MKLPLMRLVNQATILKTPLLVQHTHTHVVCHLCSCVQQGHRTMPPPLCQVEVAEASLLVHHAYLKKCHEGLECHGVQSGPFPLHVMALL